jgi:hypothetical protein
MASETASRRGRRPGETSASLRRDLTAVALEAVAVLGGFTLLAIFLTWPLVRSLGGRIYGYPGDSTGTIALLWALAHKTGYHVLGTTHMLLTGAPFGWEFSNALNVQWAFVFLPATLATKLIGEVAAYNLVILSGLVLSGAAMYLLVRRLGTTPLVAAWAGLAYTVFPWHLEKAQGHAGFVHLEGFPLLVLAVLAWHRRPDLRRALLVAAASLLLWTTAGYFGVLGSVALAVLLPVVAVLHRRRHGTLYAIAKLALGGGAALAVLVVIFAVSLAGSSDEGVSAQQNVGELSTYGARPWEYVLPSYRNPYLGDDFAPFLSSHLHGSNFSETSLYVGWLTILLAAGWLGWALARHRRLPPERIFLAVGLPLMIGAALVCSLPSPLPRTGVPTPARFLWEAVPQFRVPSRFIAVVMTGLVPLAALGLNAISARAGRLTSRRSLSAALPAAVVLAAVVITFIELPISRASATTDVDRTPAYYRDVQSAPPGLLVEYPLATADQAVNSEYLFWQRIHERRLVNGAALDTFADAVGQTLVNPSSPETPASLAALGVTAIVLRPSVYAFTGGFPAPTRLGKGYRLLGRHPEASVWQVTARPAPAVAAFRDGFSHAETPPGQPTSRWMVAPEASVDVYAFRPGTYVARFEVSSYGHPRLLRVQGRRSARLFGVFTPRTISVPVQLPQGRSSFRLTARPKPELVPDGRTVSVYVSNWRFAPKRKRPGVPLAAIPMDR